MNHRSFLLFPLLMAFCLLLPAQAPDLKLEMRNYSFQADRTDDQGRRGIGMKFDLRFSKLIEEFHDRRFELVWRLEDMNGKTVYDSKNQEQYIDQKEVLSAQKPWNKDVNYMEKTGVNVVIPFTLMHFPAGPQQLKVVFSLSNKTYDFPDFASKDIAFEQVVFVRHSLKEQTFKVSNLKFAYDVEGFAVEEPGMSIKLDISPQYGPDEATDESYRVFWMLRDNGKILFDSRKCASIHHQSDGIYLKNLKETKTERMDMFLNYSEINMKGPAEVELVLLAEAEDVVKEIYAEKHLIEVPLKYRFAEQEFSLKNLTAETGIAEGAQGLRIEFQVQLSKFGPRLDPEKGDYFVYPVIRDQKGNVLWKPESLKKYTFGSSRLSQACEAYRDEGPIKVSLFIPWYVLKLSPGTTTLQYSIFASDASRQVKFPELSKGGISVSPPPLRTYDMNMSELVMKDSDYDTEVAPFGSRLPDLSWSFRIGNDPIYTSPKRKNSLRAPTGQAKITIAEGDECSIVVYDIDSGFFNASDFLGEWKIPYMENDKNFVSERRDEGLLEVLRVEMTRLK